MPFTDEEIAEEVALASQLGAREWLHGVKIVERRDRQPKLLGPTKRCPKCGVVGERLKTFGRKRERGGWRTQSWCKRCRYPSTRRAPSYRRWCLRFSLKKMDGEASPLSLASSSLSG